MSNFFFDIITGIISSYVVNKLVALGQILKDNKDYQLLNNGQKARLSREYKKYIIENPQYNIYFVEKNNRNYFYKCK